MSLALNVLFIGKILVLFGVFKSNIPGDMLFKIAIVDAKTFHKASAGRHLGYYFAYFVSTVSVFLEFLWITFNTKKEGWHAKLASSSVIKDPP